MSTLPHSSTPISGRALRDPALIALLLFIALAYLIAFDQGQIGALLTDRMLDSGGVLHEFFHDARHLLGFPCH